MKITWYGNASLKIESETTAVLIDPFVPIAPSPVPITLSDFFGVNNILVTHGHFDHIIDIPKLCINDSFKVYATQTPINTLFADGVKANQLKHISENNSFWIGDLKITSYKAKHVKIDFMLMFGKKRFKNLLTYFSEAVSLLRLNRDYKENGEILSFLIEKGSRKIFVLGSLGIADNVEYPTQMDLLVLPYQGTYRLVDTSKKIIDRLKPKAVLLDHFDDTFPPVTLNEDTDEIIKEYAGKINILTVPYKTPITV